MCKQSITEIELNRLKQNIFAASWPAVEPADEFAWHWNTNGKPDHHFIDSFVPQSSQALMIDVFGWIKVLPQDDRNRVMNVLAGRLGLESSANWEIEFEWQDDANVLEEQPKPGPGGQVSGVTQVDVLATSADHFICIECKMTEGLGGCSQPRSNGGEIQCSGNYCSQVNPRTGVESNCALTGKGIRYWEVVPEVFNLSADVDYTPCPFANGWYQLMRNCVLAYEHGHRSGRRPAFVLLYADGVPEIFKTTAFTSGLTPGGWSEFSDLLRPDQIDAQAISYQEMIEALHAGCDGELRETVAALRQWVADKLERVEEKKRAVLGGDK